MTEKLAKRFPMVPWREPIRVQRLDGASRWACRICIGKLGLRGLDVERLWESEQQVRDHIASLH